METQETYFFDMEEVFSLEGDGHARHRDVIFVTGTVADICAYSKCNWFGLPGGRERARECQVVRDEKRTFQKPPAAIGVFRWKQPQREIWKGLS